MKNHTVTMIEICPKCKGAGLIHYEEMTDYHHREYESRYMECDVCDGHGRVEVTTTTTVEIKKIQTDEKSKQHLAIVASRFYNGRGML